MRLLAVAVLVSFLAAPCAARGESDGDESIPSLLPAGGIMLFYKSAGPLSFVTMTPRDVPVGARPLGTVTGESCQRGLSIPLAAEIRATSVSGGYGDGSFAKALEAIRKAQPEVSGVYDVRVDLRVFSVLGIYRSLCTEVTARAFAAP